MEYRDRTGFKPKDNGINVIVGQRKNSKSWDKAVADGFVPGETLFEIEEALEKGTVICYLLSDAAQIEYWPKSKTASYPGKALYFLMVSESHSASVLELFLQPM